MDPDHEVCRDDGGARNGQPPAQAAPSRASGWAVAEAGAASPERRPRAARVQRSGAQRRGYRLLEGRGRGGLEARGKAAAGG